MYANRIYYCLIILLLHGGTWSQTISLWEQFNGKYDFTFVGNTLNPGENSFMTAPSINTSSTANLTLNDGDIVEKAYLYWAGCGPGDYEVNLNGTSITPSRIFNHFRNSNGLDLEYFSAYADVTAQVQTTGNGNYTLSELDLNEWISYYYQNRTNFGGWAIIIIYRNENLPPNQINVYDGLQAVPNLISITLNSLNVVDNQNAKIGFLAWEGDENIAVNETLSINGNPLGNPPLNPFSNAFNGTNSFTGDENLFNMDLDYYNIQDNLAIGDSSASINLTSGQDFVMVNTIVTKLNSQLPDATITIAAANVACNSRTVVVHFQVNNLNATKELPSNVPIAIYANNTLVASTQTQNVIPVGGSESGVITIEIPAAISNPFDLRCAVDDSGDGAGLIVEIDEDNNNDVESVQFLNAEPLQTLPELKSCNEGLGAGTFDLSGYLLQLKQNPADVVTFYESEADLINNNDPITDIANYRAISTPFVVYANVDNGLCFQTTSFLLTTTKCLPIVYNFVSANNDGVNDTFNIKGLRDVFTQFSLKIYNRWGTLVWSGNNNTPNWDGKATEGILLKSSLTTDGTYFYSLELNDPDFPKPLYGYLFVSD